MKLPRPYIPLRVRVQVAERQANKFAMFRDSIMLGPKWTLQQRLDAALHFLFGGARKVELHHRPALCNRQWVACKTGGSTIENSWRYEPDANDPDYLVYLPADEHAIETRVRGQHGQHSDQALLRIAKRMKRKASERKFKRKWPKRKFPKRVIDTRWRIK